MRVYIFIQVIHDRFGIVEGLMTIVHAMTSENILLICVFDISENNVWSATSLILICWLLNIFEAWTRVGPFNEAGLMNDYV